jgi:hypothetical protein
MVGGYRGDPGLKKPSSKGRWLELRPNSHSCCIVNGAPGQREIKASRGSLLMITSASVVAGTTICLPSAAYSYEQDGEASSDIAFEIRSMVGHSAFGRIVEAKIPSTSESPTAVGKFSQERLPVLPSGEAILTRCYLTRDVKHPVSEKRNLASKPTSR